MRNIVLLGMCRYWQRTKESEASQEGYTGGMQLTWPSFKSPERLTTRTMTSAAQQQENQRQTTCTRKSPL